MSTVKPKFFFQPFRKVWYTYSSDSFFLQYGVYTERYINLHHLFITNDDNYDKDVEPFYASSINFYKYSYSSSIVSTKYLNVSNDYFFF